MTTRIFIAGHRGLAGSAIVRALQRRGETNLLVRTRQELDLLDQAAVMAFFATQRPTQVYLAAAKVGGIHANNVQRGAFLYDNLIIAANLIEAAAHEDANIIFGTVIDDALGDEVKVTVIAAGFDGGVMPRKASARPEVRRPELPALRPSAVPAPVQTGSDFAEPAPRPVAAPAVSRPEPEDDELDVPDFLK